MKSHIYQIVPAPEPATGTVLNAGIRFAIGWWINRSGSARHDLTTRWQNSFLLPLKVRHCARGEP
jgi:hypothetical protein